MLYLSNPLAISSVMFTPDTFKKKKKMRCIRGWVTSRDTRGWMGHWIIKYGLLYITVFLIKPNYIS